MRVLLNNLASYEALKQHVLSSGCYSVHENERIYNKWFATAPRYLFRVVDRKYHITERTLCDVGCGYGANLAFCTPDSYGIEIEEYEARFARSIGLVVYTVDILTDTLSSLPKVDAVWCSATFVPTIPLLPVLRMIPRLNKYFTGHLHGDHINAFTPATLRFFCERAGFETVEVSSFLPGILSPLSHLNLIDGCVYIGRRIEGWEYPPNATRRAAANERGFTFIGQKFGE